MPNNESYTFIRLSQEEILVIFQTCERPDVYFNDLILDLKKYTSNTNAVIYFDLLVNNGYHNRFFIVKFEDGLLKTNTIKRTFMKEEYSKIANCFFLAHWNIIEKYSVLTSVQKELFKRKFFPQKTIESIDL